MVSDCRPQAKAKTDSFHLFKCNLGQTSLLHGPEAQKRNLYSALNSTQSIAEPYPWQGRSSDQGHLADAGKLFVWPCPFTWMRPLVETAAGMVPSVPPISSKCRSTFFFKKPFTSQSNNFFFFFFFFETPGKLREHHSCLWDFLVAQRVRSLPAVWEI